MCLTVLAVSDSQASGIGPPGPAWYRRSALGGQGCRGAHRSAARFPPPERRARGGSGWAGRDRAPRQQGAAQGVAQRRLARGRHTLPAAASVLAAQRAAPRSGRSQGLGRLGPSRGRGHAAAARRGRNRHDQAPYPGWGRGRRTHRRRRCRLPCGRHPGRPAPTRRRHGQRRPAPVALATGLRPPRLHPCELRRLTGRLGRRRRPQRAPGGDR